jgi:hypothetical protein
MGFWSIFISGGASPVHENRSVIAAKAAIQFRHSGVSTPSGPRLSPG